jgi:hypothetical protein
MESAKFIQIATATASQSVMIYALDDQGNVWKCVEGGQPRSERAEVAPDEVRAPEVRKQGSPGVLKHADSARQFVCRSGASDDSMFWPSLP